MTAERLVRLYPRAWRERYGAEFLETVGSQPLHPQQVIDIAMGAIDAWLSVDVRRSSAGVVAGATHRGGPMTLSKIVCTDTKYRMTTRDGIISAAVILATTFVMMTVGIWLRKSGYLDLGEAIVSLAFPMSMIWSMPFSYMKGQPWRAQVLLVGVPTLILIGIGWLSTRI